MGVGTCLVIYLAIGGPSIGITPTDHCLVSGQIFGRWQHFQIQCVDNTIATQDVLYYMSVNLLHIALLTIPGICIAIADILRLNWFVDYGWQFSQIQCIDNTIAT